MEWRSRASVSDLTVPSPYGRLRGMKKGKAKKSTAKKTAKPAAAKKTTAKASSKKTASAKKASPAKSAAEPTPMGWGWPAFRYPLT
jgi:ribosomal protein L9